MLNIETLAQAATAANAIRTVESGKAIYVAKDELKDTLAKNPTAYSISLNLRGDDKKAIGDKAMYAVTGKVTFNDLAAHLNERVLAAILEDIAEGHQRDALKEVFLKNPTEALTASVAALDAASIAKLIIDDYSDTTRSTKTMKPEEVKEMYNASFKSTVQAFAESRGTAAIQIEQMHAIYIQLLQLLFSRKANAEFVEKMHDAMGRFVAALPDSEEKDSVNARLASVKEAQDKAKSQASTLDSLLM